MKTSKYFTAKYFVSYCGFTCSVCGPFTKNEERIQKFIKTGDTDYIFKNDLGKDCFQHVMPYGKYKDLTKRTESEKVLWGKTFEIASNPKYDEYQRGLASMVYKFLIKSQKAVALNLYQINNLQINFINQLLENLIKEVFILHLKTIFGVLISWYAINKKMQQRN